MNNTYVKFIAVLVLIAAAPFFLPLFHINLLSEILILAIFALSLNVMMGYAGMVSLGHAAFFGTGAYAAGIMAQNASANMIFTLAGAVVLSLVLAGIVGLFCMKVSGFYFLMLTLAFSQMVYSFVYQANQWTGGSNGLSGIPSPVLFGFSFSNSVWVYYLIGLIFLLIFAGLRVLVKSPFGQILIGIRENETRLKSMGYNTSMYKYAAFIISGVIGGMSGALYTYFNGFIAPSDVYWTMSGTVLIMVLVGGAGTMTGPVLGAALIVLLETVVAAYTDMWMLILGSVFIIFVIFFPSGIHGILQDTLNKWQKPKLNPDVKSVKREQI
ncbi:amino acid/amide ABC transporter membrane protein 2, HAAT family [Alteribacillus persepolensis]|uniref:Amino acid/amide ABC transporter membrane protein 2, HAAT family n=1 Tax=Alteribacillus persepolensis TaxID=568899 RepID=A0A1G8GFV7_9BACI|nr:branched-chain amino acid ABC transporter permease [Alteribacillus persepolensis]SDH93245.1 amino acid/amide ABC transporter membrane protein 2, HAAT family [Alteribacillus persepolensis]